MKRSTPFFWYKTTGYLGKFLSFLLLPLGYVYALLSRVRYIFMDHHKLSVPVICVGNLTLGGAGKTPTVIALTHLLRDHFQKNPALLTRGYGSDIIKKTSAPYAVKSDDQAARVGDEPLLLSRHAPTFIAKNRYLSGEMAIQQNADILILDDGLQNPALYKDFKLLVVDCLQGFGNHHIFPAGPLRQSLKTGLAGVDAVLLIDSTGTPEQKYFSQKLSTLIKAHAPCINIFHGFFSANTLPIQPQPIIACAGIGYPEKFRQFLIHKGYTVLEFISFPDHYVYTEKDVHDLQRLQVKYNAVLITTEKDYVKLVSLNIQNVHMLPVSLVLKEKESFLNYLSHRIPSLKSFDPLHSKE